MMASKVYLFLMLLNLIMAAQWSPLVAFTHFFLIFMTTMKRKVSLTGSYARVE